MSYIILSQKKDFKSSYKDVIFKQYHFPAKYRSTIKSGDVFIYNQGQQGNAHAKSRYYYGTGVVGNIYSLDNGVTYFAELLQCKSFYNNVPTKFNDGKYIEQLEYEGRRSRPNWESSIRPLSTSAYQTIINMAGGLIPIAEKVDIEALKSDLKLHLDDYYLNDNHQALIDVLAVTTKLIQKYGVKIF